jgi:hypothetical protein
MGYTCAEASRTIQYTCAVDSALPADTTTAAGVVQLSLPVYSMPHRVSPASRKMQSAHTASRQRPRFIIRGGFFSIGGEKKRLFAAGRLRKQCARGL